MRREMKDKELKIKNDKVTGMPAFLILHFYFFI